VAVVVAVAASGACGGGDDDGGDLGLPLVDQIAPAMAAVEAELGGPQQYFEVNATPSIVNLFVATDGGATVTPYAYFDGVLEPPAPGGSASGETFGAAEVTFDPDAVLDQISTDLPESTVTQFVVLGGAGDAVQYEADVLSAQGGVLRVVLGPDGAVLAVDPA
jgi:hypothetical protein